MENKDIYDLLDKLVLSTSNESTYKLLSRDQRQIAALELLISTTTRSGAEAFFTGENTYLYKDVEKALSLLKASESLQYYKQMQKLSSSEKKNTNEYSKLQEGIINKLFTEIRPAEEEFVKKNFKLLSENL